MDKTLEKGIYNSVKSERVVTSSEISGKFKISWNTAERYLVELLVAGKVERIKKAGVNLWTLK